MRFALQKFGIELDYKHKRTSNEIEGVSFRYNNVAFKRSEIDRKFSFGNLRKEFDKNILEARKRGRKEYLREQARQKAKQKVEEKVKKGAVAKPKNPTIRGVELTLEQSKILIEGGFIYLENMVKQDNSGKFSAYIFLNDEKNRVFFSGKKPDEFIKYGKYEIARPG